MSGPFINRQALKRNSENKQRNTTKNKRLATILIGPLSYLQNGNHFQLLYSHRKTLKLPNNLIKMLENIAQLKPVDAQWLDQVVRELSAPHVDLESLWREPYPEYGSAGLKVATLLNPTGEQENFDYHDCHSPLVTPLLEKLPTLLEFFKESDLNVMGARLLRLDPGTFLHEHRDFVYLEPVPRYRLHLPLITNAKAFITSPGINVHFEKGYLWKLDPKQTIHSACNFGDAPRIHLMLDCYVNQPLEKLVAGQFLNENLKHALPALTAQKKAELISQASQILHESSEAANLTRAEEILLKTFCLYDLKADNQDLTSYDLIFELFDSPVYAERKAYWKERLHEVYPPLLESSPQAILALTS